MNMQEYLKTLPEDEQRRIARGERLFKYIIKQRCQHPEMLGKQTQKKRGTLTSPPLS